MTGVVKVRRNFTILELLAVMVIITILAGMLLGGAAFAQRKARETKTKAQLEMIRTALNSYNRDWGFFPETGGGSDVDLDGNFWETMKAPDGQYYLRYNEDGFNYSYTDSDGNGVWTVGDEITQVLDPFGQLWRYCVPGKRNTASIDLWSKGLNETDDSASRATNLSSDNSDDIGNWKRN